MSESILPTNDVMFKIIFWNQEYPDVLISFINAILKRDNPITSIELLNTEIHNEFIGEHGVRLDLAARTSNGELLNIEMQKKNEDDIYKRSLYYWASLYYTQLKKGQKYKALHPAITINVLDFNLFDDKRSNRKFILKDEKTNEEYLVFCKDSKIQIYIVDTKSSKTGNIIVYYGAKMGRPKKDNSIKPKKYRYKYYKNSKYRLYQ